MTWERYDRALVYFDAKDFVTASKLFRELVDEIPEDVALRLFLARAYYHSAQLNRAEAELREVLSRDPVADYAHLLLGRTLQRQSRHDEAAVHLGLADAMTGVTLPPSSSPVGADHTFGAAS